VKTTKPVLVLATATALALTAAGCGSKGASQSSGSDSGPLTIGASLSLTGELAREGQLTKEGYQLCQSKVNAKGGVKVGDTKRKLSIKYQDDTSEPDTAAQLVDQFNDKGIKLMLASYGSTNTEAQAAVVERNGQVMVDSAGADDKIFQKGYQRTFAVLSPATEYSASIVDAMADADPAPKTVAFLSADDGFSKTVTKGGIAEAKKKGMKVVGEEYFPAGSTDVSSSLNKVKGKNPDAIIGSVHLEEGVAIVKQAHELHVVPSGGFGETVAPPTPDFAKTLGDQAENVLGSSQWTPTTQGHDTYFGTAKDYAADVKATFGHAPDYHDAEASAACLALTLAVEKAGSAKPDKVRDALSSLDTPSFFGHIKFNSKGQNVYKPMSVIQVQNGEAVTVWPQSAAETKMVWPGTGA